MKNLINTFYMLFIFVMLFICKLVGVLSVYFVFFCYAYSGVNKREVIMCIVHFVNAAYNF